MKGKKILTMLLAMLTLMSTLLTGCSGGASNDLLAQIKERGELIIAMEGTWAPWTYHDENDQLVGYDVEVAQLIAEKLGVKATFVEGEWDFWQVWIPSGTISWSMAWILRKNARRSMILLLRTHTIIQ